MPHPRHEIMVIVARAEGLDGRCAFLQHGLAKNRSHNREIRHPPGWNGKPAYTNPWTQRLSKVIKNVLGEKCSKANLSFEGVLTPWGLWEYAGTIGNGYSFAYAKYCANP